MFGGIAINIPREVVSNSAADVVVGHLGLDLLGPVQARQPPLQQETALKITKATQKPKSADLG